MQLTIYGFTLLSHTGIADDINPCFTTILGTHGTGKTGTKVGHSTSVQQSANGSCSSHLQYQLNVIRLVLPKS